MWNRIAARFLTLSVLAVLSQAASSQEAAPLSIPPRDNELMLAVSELGGGWGFICRLSEVEQ